MFLPIGILIGLVLGLTGSGGSVFAVPLLIMLGGVSMHHAVGLSLAAVAASAVFGSLRYKSRQPVLWLPATILTVSGMMVVPLGQWVGAQLPADLLVIAFAAVAMVIAFRMWIKISRQPDEAVITRASDLSNTVSNGLLCRLSPNGQFQMKPRCMGGLLTGGVLVGLLSGLLGVGGGFLIIPLLLFLSQVTMQQAVSTSLVVISVISTVGFISYLMFKQNVDSGLSYPVMGWLMAGGISGMYLGQILTKRIADARLQKGFSIALFLMAVAMCDFHFYWS